MALAVLAAVSLFATALFRVPVKADEGNAFDDSAILDDLSDFDLASFPADSKGELELLRFMEYGYSADTATDYGLYVYVYNPKQVELSTRTGANTMNLALSYASGKPTSYANVDLKFCDVSKGAYSRLFYKFRVSGEALYEIYSNARTFEKSSGKRRYDVAGVQFWQKGLSSATLKVNTSSAELGAVKDYSVDRTFYFTGYAKGYGKGVEESATLACSYEELVTIKLDLQHTNYRLDDTYKPYTYEEVNSVYFSVPNEIFEQYGDLKKIKAEWYEYKTNPIFVTKDESGYNELLDWIGVDVGEYTAENNWRVWWDFELEDTVVDNPRSMYLSLYNQRKGTNETDDRLQTFLFPEDAKNVTKMDWLFYRKSPSVRSDYEVTRAEVEEWAKQYTLDNSSQKKVQARKTFYAEGLFASDVDEGRTRGYNVQEIEAGETVDLLQYKDQTWWEKFIGTNKKTETAVSYDPIVLVKESDLKGSASYVCDNLLVNERDFEAADGENNAVGFKEYCETALQNDETPVLFRFANTDYYASKARFDSRRNKTHSDYDGYVSQQTCFLDFDVISLTFEKEGTETVLAAVSDPIDIFNGATPPNDLHIGASGCAVSCGGDWKKTFGIVLLVIAVLVAWKIYRKVRDAITLRRARKEQRRNRKRK